MNRHVNRILGLLTVAVLVTLDIWPPPRARRAIGVPDRVADAYFAALGARDPSRAPMGPTVRFTEQAQALKVGEGLWKTASEAPATFRIYVADPVPVNSVRSWS
jgi:hypothetical protein